MENMENMGNVQNPAPNPQPGYTPPPQAGYNPQPAYTPPPQGYVPP